VPAGLDGLHVLLEYSGPGRDLVARVKYRNARASIDWLGSAAAALLPASTVERTTTLTWAPTTSARRSKRGFDHAELLARRIGSELDVPVGKTLRRAPGPPQTGRTPAERRGQPGRFSVNGRLNGLVVVVDDVITTGATLSAAAATLRSAGAASVVGLVAAATPLKRTRD
jgi:predicted amidophosphoribosyltransferase